MDYSDIIESNLKWANGFKATNRPLMLILHHAEASNCSIQDIHQWHLENGWTGCGYHFLIKKDGSIWRGRPENAMGSHCLGANEQSLGLCAEGNYMTETMPEVQKSSIVELSKYLISKYGIKQVYGHKEIRKTNSTNCPGDNYPLEEIKELIFSKGKLKEVKKMENIVVYSGEGDKPSAELLAFYLQCPLIALNASRNTLDSVENIYIVGGVEKPVKRAKLIFGVDRFETMKEVLKFMGKL